MSPGAPYRPEVCAVTLVGPGTVPIAMPGGVRLAPGKGPRKGPVTIGVAIDGGAGFGVPGPTPFRFDHARNFARLVAARHAPWCLYVDADMVYEGELDASRLDPAVGVYSIPCTSAGVRFASPLLVHYTCTGRWHGRTHEFFSHPATPYPGDLTYRETPKGPEALERKATRDLVLLTEQIREEPHEIRWRMYRAQTFELGGSYRDAFDTYRDAADLAVPSSSAWDREQAAWCEYKAARVALDALVLPSEAEYYARRALRLWPTHREARALLRELGATDVHEVPDPGRVGFREP